jgi:hypothetical protein
MYGQKINIFVTGHGALRVNSSLDTYASQRIFHENLSVIPSITYS